VKVGRMVHKASHSNRNVTEEGVGKGREKKSSIFNQTYNRQASTLHEKYQTHFGLFLGPSIIFLMPFSLYS